jgi:glycosyltransferase involved in cell wall biosynthesis
MQRLWRSTAFPPFDWLAGAADCYHFPNFILPPLRRGRAVVTIHDLAFVHFPESIEARNLGYLRTRIRDTVRRSDAIIAVSRFTADDIISEFDVPADRVHAIHSGLDPLFAPPSPDAMAAARERLHLDRPYILVVGTLEPRKNIPFLVDVFDRLERFDGDLVLAGMPGWKVEPILARLAESPRRQRIRRVAHVEDTLLPALYGGAECLWQGSLYEGFGWPPLEAMACGTPVLSSTGGSLPEVLGEAAVLIDTFDSQRWAHETHRVLEDSALRTRLKADGREQAGRYRWETTARQTWDVYRGMPPRCPGHAS